jgi:L-arabonate dehydrase
MRRERLGDGAVTPKPENADLRSQGWFRADGRPGKAHRGSMQIEGIDAALLDGRPVIGVCNSWSELAPCNVHLRHLAEYVKRGVWQAGGVPLEFPTMSLGEQLMRPTAMLFRNLMSMDVEETLRANPLDGVVLLSGCDKTTPAQLMGAASVDLPTIMVSGGPMLPGNFRGRDVGAGTDTWRFDEEHRRGNLTAAEVEEAHRATIRSQGHCMTMGTASTMACLAEVLGLQLPGSAELAAVDARKAVLAQEAGRRVVQLVHDDVRMSQIATRGAFENAIKVNAALGGSTNAIIHLTAIAGRLGVPLELDDFHELGADVPLLVNLKPSGDYLMEDFMKAGGIRVVIRELGERLDGTRLTVNGATLGENSSMAQCWNPDVIGTVAEPVQAAGQSTTVLRGNLCPDGAVIKRSAASPGLMQHRGPAVVFDSIEEYMQAVDSPDLEVVPESVLVLRNSGPRGYPGMPEVGNLRLPQRMVDLGVKDMVRISDARMSGTAYGTVVLHVSPESAVGGPLSLVQTGDEITLDVAGGRLTLEVDEAELARRAATWSPPETSDSRGYTQLYREHVLQAHQGADFDFLVGGSGAPLPRQPL